MKNSTYENLCVGSVFLCMLFSAIYLFSVISFFLIEPERLVFILGEMSGLLSLISLIILVYLLKANQLKAEFKIIITYHEKLGYPLFVVGLVLMIASISIIVYSKYLGETFGILAFPFVMIGLCFVVIFGYDWRNLK